MNNLEMLLFYACALFLAGSLFTSILGLVFGRPRSVQVAIVLMAIGTVVLTAFGIERWLRTGHPPFVSLFESMMTSIWFMLVIFQVIRWRASHTTVVLPPVAGIALALLGWAVTQPAEAAPLSKALTNVWLFIHASFATAGAGTFLIGASYAVIFLQGPAFLDRMRRTVKALPDHAELPRSMVTFLLFGLVLWGVMIVSGSIWAHVAWGRYWAWDPIELWSLLSWLLYGLLYHARMAWRLPDRTFCWLNLIAVGTVAFSLWGIQYIYETVHTYG